MKRIIAYSMILFAVSSCSKEDSISKEKVISTENEIQGRSAANPTPSYYDDGKKKYTTIICYIPGDPSNVGTECSVPGDKCKQSGCTLTSAAKVMHQLTESEINYYASLDAQLLLKKGIIDEINLEYFRNFSKNILIERNKKLLAKPTK